MRIKVLIIVAAMLAAGVLMRANAQGYGHAAPLNGSVTRSSGLFDANSLNSFAGAQSESSNTQAGNAANYYGNANANARQDAQLNQVAHAAVSPSFLSGGVTAKDLSNIARHDVILIIDKSGSMETEDCPDPMGAGSAGSGMYGAGTYGANAGSYGGAPSFAGSNGNGASGYMRQMLNQFGMSGMPGMAQAINAYAGMNNYGGMNPQGMQFPGNYPGMQSRRHSGQPGFGQFGQISRWDWCREETMDLARQTRNALPQGMKVILFSTGMQTFDHVQLNQIPQIFAQNSPRGSTNTDAALRAALSDYFRRRDEANGNVKPLLVAVITDGLPNNPRAVNEVIEEANSKVRNPNEISITFLQIGHDPESFDLLRQTASLPLVQCKPFDSLVRVGLTKALVDCVNH